MPRIKDITGVKFGRLTAVSQTTKRAWNSVVWECECDCGTIAYVDSSSLRKGNTKSCGCLKAEAPSRTLAYRSWTAMRSRCNDPAHSTYRFYGGRGIRICDRWSDFSCFLEDMGERPNTGYWLDRIDSDGDYEPTNCRWATIAEQQSNRRSNRYLTHGGECLTLQKWADRAGMTRNTLEKRIDSYGWSLEQALTKPVRFLRPRSNRDHETV